jgi:hypothetical protein
MATKIVFECLQLDFSFKITEEFKLKPDEYDDQRHLVSSKRKSAANLEEYIQVFQVKYGYIPNLSILDLLFNTGPSALGYLDSQTLIQKD